MSVPAWQPGTLYLPGAIVVPQTAAQVSTVTLQNPGFESGNGTGWTISGATPSFSKLHPYAGTYTCTFYTSDGDPTLTYEALNDENPSCAEGAVVTATLAVKLATQGIASARAVIVWYDGVGVEIDRAEATLLERPTPNDGNYVISTVNGVAPVGTASCKCGVTGTVGDGGDVRLDAMTLKFQQAGLMYKAVQPAQGTSDSTEPAWPAVLGATVVDNTVTWEAILLSIVTWQASPIAVSGASEPTWPTTPLERVTDGSVAWECFTRAVEDENCPRTKVVAIMSAKVFAADGDIVRFSATANPLNWSDEQDAGYLPTGLQQANANDMAVLAPYRANLVGLNASSFQNWQVDPDPASMALLDQMDGIGSTWHKAAVPVANDLFYLSQLGVRTVGIAAGAENLAAGDVGMPIDSLVQDALRVAGANSTKALATYYPGAGQYWLAFNEYPAPLLTLAGNVPGGYVGQSASGTYTAAGGVLPRGAITVTSGTFPPGLTLHPSGNYSGTFTTGGSFAWTVGVTDADGSTATCADTAEVAVPVYWDASATGTGGVLTNGTRTFNSDTPSGQRPLSRSFNAATPVDKFYCEIVINNLPASAGGDPMVSIGLVDAAHAISAAFVGYDSDPPARNGIGWLPPHGTAANVTQWAQTQPYMIGGAAPAEGDVMMLAADRPAGKYWLGKNGSWVQYQFGAPVAADPATGTNPSTFPPLFDFSGKDVYVAITGHDNGSDHLVATLRIHAFEFTHAVPDGFTPLGEL